MASTDVERISTLAPTVLSEEDKQAIAASFDRRIAEATTVDEVFDSPTTLGLEDVENKPVTVSSIRFHESGEQYRDNGGLGVFAVMDTDLGILTTGSRTPCMKLAKVAELGGLPITVRFFIGARTKNGTVWDVERA